MQKKGRMLRVALLSAVAAVWAWGCSGGGGNPVLPDSPAEDEAHFTPPVHSEPGSVPRGGRAMQATPPLAWEFTQPAELLDEGWGLLPATRSTSLSVSAALYGELAEEFNGDVYFSVDGKSQPFSFDGNVLVAEALGLDVGPHQLFVSAGSSVGLAARDLRFEVVDRPPALQVGIGEDDGKLYVTVTRPMPPSQLGDPSRWNCVGFGSDKQGLEVLPDNQTVVIQLTSPLSLWDMPWFLPDGLSPKVLFNSSLGEAEGLLIPPNEDSPGSRSGQSPNCDKGEVTEDECTDALEWVIEREHLVSEGCEPRQFINTEAWYPYVIEPWSDCFSYIIVRHNWAYEGHLDPSDPDNWDASYDSLWYSEDGGYFGVGYLGGVYQYYHRNHGYYTPSWCDWYIEHEVDCNNCNPDPYDPPGYESKGWHLDGSGDDLLVVDHEPPTFDEVKFVPGEEINDYVADSLIPDLVSLGVVYRADDSTEDLYEYYMQRVGQYIDDWLIENPAGLCLVVRAQDETGSQGKWLHGYLSVDYEDGAGRHCEEDANLHIFYADIDPLGYEERTEEEWPKLGAGGLYWDPNDMHLHIDGYAHGEYSAWVIPVDCAWFYNYTSCRLRASDDINNWTRTVDLALDDEIGLEIVSPDEYAKYEYNDPIVFMAQITGNYVYQTLEEYIEWEILTPDYQSVVPEWEDWKGPTFTVAHMRDCLLTVKASLNVCGVEYSDERTVVDPPDITLDVEDPPYWIDGPSIPIYEGQEGDWHDTSLEKVEVEAWGQCACCDRIQHKMEPVPYWEDVVCPDHEWHEGMRPGVMQLRVCVSDPYCEFQWLTIDIYGPQGQLDQRLAQLGAAGCNQYCSISCPWTISSEDCGEHTIRVACWLALDVEPPLAEVEKPVTLSMVTQGDIVRIAWIYDQDKYVHGYQCCPHQPWREPPDRPGCMDCSGLVTQLLRRLYRSEPGTGYPIHHRCSTCWNDQSINDETTWDLVQPGDLVVYSWGHVAIFNKWLDQANGKYQTWEARGTGIPVGRQTRYVSAGGTPCHWLENVVFKTCP